MLEKREFSAEERRSLADEGKALPDGSYPIETRQDLRNGCSIGRAKNRARAIRHIRRRAIEMGVKDCRSGLMADLSVVLKKRLALVLRRPAGFDFEGAEHFGLPIGSPIPTGTKAVTTAARAIAQRGEGRGKLCHDQAWSEEEAAEASN